MFVIFDLFISSHPHILMFVCTCLYPRILTSSYLQIHMPLLTSLQPHILRFVYAFLYPSILTSSCPHTQVYMCQLVSSHPCILISSGSCVLALYSCILTASYPHVTTRVVFLYRVLLGIASYTKWNQVIQSRLH